MEEKLTKEQCKAALIHYDIVTRYLEFQLESIREDTDKAKKRLQELETEVSTSDK